MLRNTLASGGPIPNKQVITSKIARILDVNTEKPTTVTNEGAGRFADGATVLLLALMIGTLLAISGFSTAEDTEVLNRTLSTFSRSLGIRSSSLFGLALDLRLRLF